MDSLVFGQRLRYFRKRNGYTLTELGKLINRPAPYLSQLENGNSEPRVSLVGEIASILDCTPADLLDPEPPSRRAELEIDLRRLQEDPRNQERKLPYVRPSARMPDEVLEHIVGLYEALGDETLVAPTEMDSVESVARNSNIHLRREMRERNNYFEEIEELATEILGAVNYPGAGPVSERILMDVCDYFGFTVQRAENIPHSTRSITDQREKIIYIPQRNDLPTRASRSVILQTLGHYALDHEVTDDIGEYLRQRIESNYFAAAILAPEKPAITFLQNAYDTHDISVEDLQEIFYISYEMAGHRLTNLATKHLGLSIHFLRSDDEGVVWKAYENDDVPLPRGIDGTIEGEHLCRNWGTRQAFHTQDSFSLHYQYTDTPSGQFWCVTYVEADRLPHHAVTIGTTADQAKWFRGSDTKRFSTSYCPDKDCCSTARTSVRQHWHGVAWPSARDRSNITSGLPLTPKGFSRFPGVDMVEVYEFLERQESP
ncbi:MAG TPA: helix-turn-helix domain-containing protein [Acidimicrobiales bacterium]|jgi:predicted transcriptional regulator/DNA-binding XRE family transcriptional regulator|nr:helix-turn-helix domain-containing protein [Acidimicrobiales bacterium]